MMYIYLCLFLMSVPALVFFYSGNEVTKWDLKNFFAAFSLGNVGATGVACNSASMPVVVSDLTGVVADNSA